jgi:NAD(P)-dependent dehydrogenase (short-subunit alcohol dehydrogenase family)
MSRLEGKVAVITGATGGIGSAAARLFAEEGARVALVDLDEAALRETVRSIGEDKAIYTVADVTQPEQTQAYINEAVNHWGGIDVLLANAGIEGTLAHITDYPTDVFDRVMAVNVRGVWLGIKYAVPVMRERGGGSIVITSSTAGIGGTPEMSAYGASKHAVIGLMRTAALEFAPSIRVNTVNPAPIETRMMRSIEEMRVADLDDANVTVDVVKQAAADRIPLQRYGEPEEVANLMLFLASDDSSFSTGGVYMVDGGRSAGGR